MTFEKQSVILNTCRYSQAHSWPLLEILTVMPEELESRAVRIGENRRLQMLHDLKGCAHVVNEFLSQCLTLYNDYPDAVKMQGQIKIIRCFTSWVSVNAIALDNIQESLLIGRVFSILKTTRESDPAQTVPGALHDAATDCICTLLQCLEDNNNQMVSNSYCMNLQYAIDRFGETLFLKKPPTLIS